MSATEAMPSLEQEIAPLPISLLSHEFFRLAFSVRRLMKQDSEEKAENIRRSITDDPKSSASVEEQSNSIRGKGPHPLDISLNKRTVETLELEPIHPAVIQEPTCTPTQVAEALERYILSGGIIISDYHHRPEPVLPRIFACPVCPATRKKFRGVKEMEAHLKSGYHRRTASTNTTKVEDPISISIKSSASIDGGENPDPPAQGPVFFEPLRPIKYLPARKGTSPPKPITIPPWITSTERQTFCDLDLLGIDTTLQETQVLVISPTRPLAIYVVTYLADRCASMGITAYATVGGTVVREDKIMLPTGPHIVSGTLGRVVDMIKRECLRVKSVSMLVLNKEDLLLTKYNEEQLTEVCTAMKDGVVVMKGVMETLIDIDYERERKLAGGGQALHAAWRKTL